MIFEGDLETPNPFPRLSRIHKKQVHLVTSHDHQVVGSLVLIFPMFHSFPLPFKKQLVDISKFSTTYHRSLSTKQIDIFL